MNTTDLALRPACQEPKGEKEDSAPSVMPLEEKPRSVSWPLE